MLEKISLMRHGEKIGPGNEDQIARDLEQLDVQDQRQWTEAVNSLGVQDNPEIRPQSIIRIREIAQEVVAELPEHSLVMLANTMTPRTRLSADFLHTEIVRAASSANKEISVVFIWQPSSEKENDQNPIHLPSGPNSKNMLPIAKKVLAEKYPDVDAEAYFRTGGGQQIPDEDEFISELVHLDLNSANSDIKKRVDQYQAQINTLKEWSQGEQPVFFIGVGHHMSLVTLDMFNKGVREYSAKEMPQPLDKWSFDLSK